MSALTGQQLKDAGIERIQKRKWHDEAFKLLCDVIGWGGLWPDEFTASHVKSVLSSPNDSGGFNSPPHPNCWGALINAAAKAGLIERVGYRPSREPSAHRRIVSVWRRK